MRLSSRVRCGSRATAPPGASPSRSKKRAVPLSKIQIDVLRLLATHRDPESYVAGATPLNRDAPRYSSDIDVFHDRQERVASAALSDAQALAVAGYGGLCCRANRSIPRTSRSSFGRRSMMLTPLLRGCQPTNRGFF